MKYAAAGLGSFAVAVAFVACSGSSLNSPSKGQPDAGPDASPVVMEAGPSGCSMDAPCPQGFCDAKRSVCVECKADTDCVTGKQCNAGACQKAACVPNSTFCSEGSVLKCGPDGESSTASAHCTSDQFCLEKNDTATCSATACFPGDALCIGNVATQCQPDGSGPKPGGTDCSASKQTCYSGGCRDAVCTAGKKLCDNGMLYLCSDAGTSRALLDTCSSGQVCDPDAGACQPKVCDPGLLGCDSTRLVTCNAAGSAWLQSGTDCATKNSICSAGSCVKLACTPGMSFCQDNKVFRCSFDGTSSSISIDCNSYQNSTCTTQFGYPNCTQPACTPGALGCNGSVLAKCMADGSGFESTGTDCSATNTVCSNNQCLAPVCKPGTLFCSQGNAQQCDQDQGLTFTQLQFCATGTACKADGTSAECKPTPCFPDTDGCAGEKIGHCAEDGMSVGGAGLVDCGAAGKVCTPDSCAASAVTTLSGATQISTGGDSEMPLNVLVVESPRKLITIEANLSLPTTRSLTWVVFQETDANQPGEFDLKYQKTTSASGVGFASSGPISVELTAGATYAIGVSVGGGNFVYYYDTVTAPPSLGFAHATDSTDQPFGPQLYLYDPGSKSSSLFNQRLTTTVP